MTLSGITDNTSGIADLPITLGTVPAGKRLVVQHVSYYSVGDAGSQVNAIRLYTIGPTGDIRLYVPVNPLHETYFQDGSFPATAYFESGEQVAAQFQLNTGGITRQVRIIVTGYYVTL